MTDAEFGTRGPRIVNGVESVLALEGQILGTSDWVKLDQAKIDAFAEVTGDDHWSHVDPVRSRASPAGRPIAHGLLTLSLHPSQFYSMVEFRGFRGLFNYGYDRIRFPAQVEVDSSVRITATVIATERTSDGAKATIRFEYEADTAAKPVCVADYVQYFQV